MLGKVPITALYRKTLRAITEPSSSASVVSATEARGASCQTVPQSKSEGHVARRLSAAGRRAGGGRLEARA